MSQTPACAFCSHGCIIYAERPDGTVKRLLKIVACDCEAGKKREIAGLAPYGPLFARKCWARCDQRAANVADNQRRQDALVRALAERRQPDAVPTPEEAPEVAHEPDYRGNTDDNFPY
jgi:hypothetical protein